MVHYKPEFAHPDKRVYNGTSFSVVKVKRHRIHPAKIAGAMTFWQVLVQSLMERYPWAVIENVMDWLSYRYALWRKPRFAVLLSTSGKRIAVKAKLESSPSWIFLGTKKAQK